VSLFDSLPALSLEPATPLPYLTLHLASDGMRVIRVENPQRGDPNRWVGGAVLPASDGESGNDEVELEAGMDAYYLPNNLGKESITLNLTSEQGRALLHRLVA